MVTDINMCFFFYIAISFIENIGMKLRKEEEDRKSLINTRPLMKGALWVLVVETLKTGERRKGLVY